MYTIPSFRSSFLVAAAVLLYFSPLQGQEIVREQLPVTPQIQSEIRQIREKRAEVLRVTPKALSVDILKERGVKELGFEAFADVKFRLRQVKISQAGTGAYNWIGQVVDQPGSQAIISVKDGRAYGTIRTGTRVYEIRPLKQGGHLIIEIDPAKFREDPDDATPPDPSAPPVPAPDPETGDGQSGGGESRIERGAKYGPGGLELRLRGKSAGDLEAWDRVTGHAAVRDADLALQAIARGPFINVLVAYTNDAEDATADIELLAQNAIAVTNQSYVDAGVGQRLHLVGVVDLDYNEGGASLKTLRNRLRAPSDDQMDGVHGIRNARYADLVALLSDAGGGCGIAYIMDDVGPDFQSWGFSNTDLDCAVGNLSFAHELGHNMGARHDWYVDDTDNGPFSFNHGHYNIADNWRTVMSYNDACSDAGGSCTRLGRWSNPGQTIGGDAVGADTANNARTLNETAGTVSRFRMLGQNEAGDQFGRQLVAGDFDGDGLMDLAVAAPREAPGGDPQSGYVFLYHGTEFGLAPWRGLSQRGLGSNEAGDGFGSALAVGDFNGDGRDDLAVGAPGESPGDKPRSGWVFVFRGTTTGVTAWKAFGQEGLGADERGDRFGAALAAADFDGDGRDDLAVGGPGEEPGDKPRSGWVFVFRGTPGGMSPWKGFGQEGLGADERGDRFGAALAAGDFDGDGRADLAVGGPGEEPGDRPRSGWAFVFRGTPGGMVPWKGLGQEGLGADEAGDRFGEALAAGDFDGDGKADLAVGAPGEQPGGDPRSGYVFTFRGDTGANGLRAWRGVAEEQ